MIDFIAQGGGGLEFQVIGRFLHGLCEKGELVLRGHLLETRRPFSLYFLSGGT